MLARPARLALHARAAAPIAGPSSGPAVGLAAFVTATVACACVGAPSARPEPPARVVLVHVPAAPPPLPVLVLPTLADGARPTSRVTTLGSRDELSLTGPRADAEPGDLVLRSAGMTLTVSAKDGALLDFAPDGARDELVRVAPHVFLGLGAADTEVTRAFALASGMAVIERRVQTKPLWLHTYVWLEGDVAHVETAVRAADPRGAGLAVTLGERLGFGNVPTWVEGTGFARTAGSFSGAFVGRQSLGTAFALGEPDGRTTVRMTAGDGPGYYGSGRTGDQLVVVPLAGEAPRRHVLLAHSARSLGDAAQKLLTPSRRASHAGPAGLPREARVEVGRCGTPTAAGRFFARFAPGEPLVVPAGECFEARVSAPGYRASPWLPIARAGELTLPPSGSLAVLVRDADGRLPARIQVRGEGKTPSPDWGDDPERGAALDTIHTETGEASRPLPPGTYRVLVDHGFEHTAFDQVVTIEEGKARALVITLTRVVDTTGWLAADLHLHALPSSDAPQPLEDRVRALAAAGVEVGVATDHNEVTDYAPAIAALGLGDHVRGVVGDEITTDAVAFGHFNVFPLEAGSAPLAWEGTSPRRLFAEARERAPLFAEGLVQVNHPRMADIGYFDLARFDRDDVPGFAARAPEASLAFDALEVYNGDDYVSLARVEHVLRDWYALLDAGRFVTATGNSDSHKLTFHEVGVPRTYVRAGTDKPRELDLRAFVRALREGRAVVSGGPFVTLDVAGKGPGEAVTRGRHQAVARFEAPPWLDVSSLELVVRGATVATVKGPFKSNKRGAVVGELRHELSLGPGDWALAIARGDKEIAHLRRRGGKALSFTNPVRVAP
jgi:hypothetical protein